MHEGFPQNTLIKLFLIILFLLSCCSEQSDLRIIQISDGWAHNSINTVIFRHNSIVSDREFQYIAFMMKMHPLSLPNEKLMR
jgi:hypothetical protein